MKATRTEVVAVGKELIEAHWHEGRFRRASDIHGVLAELAEDSGEKARELLHKGLAEEMAQCFEVAVRTYQEAMHGTATDPETLYYLHNNAGHCLNILGNYEEAERECRKAIAIHAGIHNAHKNLGVSLQAQGRMGEAVEELVEATRLCPMDQGAYWILRLLAYGNCPT